METGYVTELHYAKEEIEQLKERNAKLKNLIGLLRQERNELWDSVADALETKRGVREGSR